MSMFGLQGANYPMTRYPVYSAPRNSMRNAFGQNGINEQSSAAPNGKARTPSVLGDHNSTPS